MRLLCKPLSGLGRFNCWNNYAFPKLPLPSVEGWVPAHGTWRMINRFTSIKPHSSNWHEDAPWEWLSSILIFFFLVESVTSFSFIFLQMQSRPISNLKLCKSNISFKSSCFEVMWPTESSCIFLTNDRHFQVQKAYHVAPSETLNGVIGWMFVVPPGCSYLGVLVPVCGVRMWVSGRWLGHEGGALMNEIST